MTREEEIRARFNTLPYATDDTKSLESCCGSDGGTGIMDDFGHRIADEVLEPYLQFFIEAPDDIDYLLKKNQRLQDAFERIRNRANQAERQFENRQCNSNRWDLSWWRGHADGLHKASEIIQQTLRGDAY